MRQDNIYEILCMDKGGVWVREIYCLIFSGGGYCIAVVFIHIQFPGAFGKYVETVAKTAVPFFFTISGFYLGNDSGILPDNVIKKRMIKLLRMIGIAMAIYLCNDLLRCWFGNAETNLSIQEYIQRLISPEVLMKFIAFHIMPVTMPMGWFLLAELYAYGIMLVLNKTGKLKFAYHFIPLLFGGYFLIRVIIPVMAGVGEDNDWIWLLARNWLFDALPFMLLGKWIADCQDDVRKYIKSKAALMYVVFFSFTAIGEYIMLSCLERACDYYISNIIVVICIFAAAINKGGQVKESNIFVKIGRKHSAFIYVMHGFMIMAMNTMIHFLHIKSDYIEWILPICVLAATLLCSAIWNQIYSRISLLRKLRS